jgi:NADH-quinone oxidoreductase subunit G
LGEGTDILAAISAGRHRFAKVLKAAERPMLILGSGALTRPDGARILATARRIADDCGLVVDGWNGFNVLHRAAARVGGLDLGLVPGAGGRDVAAIVEGAAKGDVEVLYLLGADEIDMSGLGGAFVIYQGHHGDAGAHRADVILPGAAYTEKNATYVNTEGRAQMGRLAVQPPGEAREDWTIIRALSAVLGKTLAYDTLNQVRDRMIEVNANFANPDAVEPAPWGDFGEDGELDPAPLATLINNFYMTDPISRASATMARCSELLLPSQQPKTTTDG